MTAQQLKNSILQMAVQGKLVPQDPNDEPASVLLERIRAEKEQLIKEGKIKKEKNPSRIFRGADNLPYEQVGKNAPVCIADEVPFEIPESWEWVRIKSLGSIIRGSGIKRNETVSAGAPCVRYGEIYTTYNVSFRETVSYIPKERYDQCKHFSNGDILMTLTGENKPDIAKAVAYLGESPVAAGGDLCYWTAHGMNPLYLTYLMAAPYVIGRKVELATGDIIVHISGDKLGSIMIPVPPLNEQNRIVTAIQSIEKLLAEYHEKESRLCHLSNEFPDRLKKSILQMAVQGKLVPQDPTDEPASVLLKRIRAEKERLIKEGKIKRDKHESVIFRRDNSHYEKLDGIERCIDDELPFEIPESWAWVRLSHISKSIADGDHQPPPQSMSGIPFVVISNLSDGYLDMSNTRHVSEDYFSTLDDKRIAKRGDILYTVTGSYGLSVIVDTDIPFCFQRHMALIKPLINLKFLFYVLSSPVIKQQADRDATGIAQKTVGIKSLSNFLVPLPPEQEQLRIVQALDKYNAIKFTI